MKDIKHEKKNVTLGYTREKPNRGGGYTFLNSPHPWKFLICHFYPYKFQRKQAFTPGNPANILENCVPLFRIPKSKTKTHWNFTWFFLEFPWKFHFFFYSPLEFPHFFFNILGNSTKFDLDFSGIEHYCSCIPTFFKLWFGVYHIHYVYKICYALVPQCKCNITRVII